MIQLRLVIDVVHPRAFGPNVGKPPKFYARWEAGSTSVYRSKRCDDEVEASRLATNWLDRQNDLRRSAGALTYKIVNNNSQR